MDRGWVAVNKLVLDGLKDRSSFDQPPKTDRDLEWLADATISDHVISGVVPRTKGLRLIRICLFARARLPGGSRQTAIAHTA